MPPPRGRHPACSASSPARTSKAEGLGGLPPNFMPEDIGGPKGLRTRRPILAVGKVRCVGDRVAMVVAETLAQARDAAELLAIDYEPLPAVVNIEDAVEPGAPPVWDECPGNVSFTLAVGDEKATAAAFAAAAHRISLRLENNRLAPNAMEPRAALGQYEPADGTYTLYTSSQAPHAVRSQVAGHVFGLPETSIRVIAPDVGGGFGVKADAYPEDALVLWAARKCGRPVKWIGTRSDALLGDNHGRDQVVHAELALDAAGKILAIRAHALHAVGAYIVVGRGRAAALFAALCAGRLRRADAVADDQGGVHPHDAARRLPRCRPARGHLSDRAPDGRGRRPDRARRRTRSGARNFIAPGKMPYATATDAVYDSGEFERLMDECMALADWNGYRARQAASKRNGKLRGRSVSYYIEHAGIFNDRMDVRFDPSGSVTILAGTHSHGQGHATTFAQLVSEWLGVPFESIRYLQGDTDKVPFGRGTYAARSSVIGSAALRYATNAIIEKGAARRLRDAGSGGRGHRLRAGNLPGQRHRSRDPAHRRRQVALPAGSSARRGRSRPRRQRHLRRRHSELSQRLPRGRGRDRSRHRTGGDRPLHRGRRLRRSDQPHDLRRADPGRARAGHRPGAARARRLRPPERAARHRQLHGLRRCRAPTTWAR